SRTSRHRQACGRAQGRCHPARRTVQAGCAQRGRTPPIRCQARDLLENRTQSHEQTQASLRPSTRPLPPRTPNCTSRVRTARA
ncbi:hypothetical protein C7E25_23765, partial [Stenotrophomonas maltophilia]